MEQICPKCGLNKELCVCETIAKEEEKIKIQSIARRFRKITTTVSGMGKGIDKKKILKELKTRLACGGTIKDDVIEIQGNHKDRVKQILIKLGFDSEKIEIS